MRHSQLDGAARVARSSAREIVGALADLISGTVHDGSGHRAARARHSVA